MPTRSPTSRSRPVSSMSAREGAGSPDGWLWQKMTAAVALADQRAEHVARVDLDAGQRAAREAGLALNAMAHVEPDRPELLDRQRRQPAAEIRPDLGRARQPLAADRPPGGGASAQLQRRQHQRRAHGPDAARTPASSTGVARSSPAGPPTPRSTAAATSTALAPRVPVPSTMASSSPSVSCSAPRAVSRSRGRASGSRAAIVAMPSMTATLCQSRVETSKGRDVRIGKKRWTSSDSVLGWLSTLVVRGFFGPHRRSMGRLGSRLLATTRRR